MTTTYTPIYVHITIRLQASSPPPSDSNLKLQQCAELCSCLKIRRNCEFVCSGLYGVPASEKIPGEPRLALVSDWLNLSEAVT